MKTILFVNTLKEQCGVHQYGLNFFNLLRESNQFSCEYIAPATFENFKNRLDFKKNIEKSSYDYIIVNYHNQTTTKPYGPMTQFDTGSKNICLFHDFYEDITTGIKNNAFYKAFIIGDPSLCDVENKVYGIGRILINHNVDGLYDKNSLPSAGSCGFAGSHKRYYDLVNLMQDCYDEAIINIHIPLSDNSNPPQTIEHVQNLPGIKMIHQSVKKPGIKVNITHDFMTQEQTIEFLAKNTINIFSLENSFINPGAGISSSLDAALCAKRPFAISNCFMFRHILKYKFPIDIEKNSIKDIIDRGIDVLSPAYKDWSRDKVLNNIEQIILGS